MLVHSARSRPATTNTVRSRVLLKNGLMRKLKYLLPAVVVVASGCATAPPVKVAAAPPPTLMPSPVESKATIALPAAFVRKGVAIKVESMVQSPDGAMVAVRGVAKNVTTTDLKFCDLGFSGRDASGQVVNSAKAMTRSLKAGSTWQFEAPVSGSTAADVRSIETERVIAIPVKARGASLASNDR